MATTGAASRTLLLAAFIVDIDPGLNITRLVLFNVGAVAIVVAVYRRQGAIAPSLALIGAIPTLLANAWYLAMVALAAERARPFAGDFGFAFFLAGAAMWLTDALFGFVALRLGVVERWGALALAIGSVLAFTGMDRLALSPPDNPTIFGPLALAGIALNGFGWIVLGIDIAARDGASATALQEARS